MRSLTLRDAHFACSGHYLRARSYRPSAQDMLSSTCARTGTQVGTPLNRALNIQARNRILRQMPMNKQVICLMLRHTAAAVLRRWLEQLACRCLPRG